jgi:chemotaxis protein histidine kinase CheA
MKISEEYKALFFEEARKRMRTLQDASILLEMQEDLPTSNLKDARIAAHSLKGDAMMMEFGEIVEIAAALEKLLLDAEASEGKFDPNLFLQYVQLLIQLIGQRNAY